MNFVLAPQLYAAPYLSHFSPTLFATAELKTFQQNLVSAELPGHHHLGIVLINRVPLADSSVFRWLCVMNWKSGFFIPQYISRASVARGRVVLKSVYERIISDSSWNLRINGWSTVVMKSCTRATVPACVKYLCQEKISIGTTLQLHIFLSLPIGEKKSQTPVYDPSNRDRTSEAWPTRESRNFQ